MNALSYQDTLTIASALRDKRDSYLKIAELVPNAKFWKEEAERIEWLALFFEEAGVRLTDGERDSIRITCKVF